MQYATVAFVQAPQVVSVPTANFHAARADLVVAVLLIFVHPAASVIAVVVSPVNAISTSPNSGVAAKVHDVADAGAAQLTEVTGVIAPKAAIADAKIRRNFFMEVTGRRLTR